MTQIVRQRSRRVGETCWPGQIWSTLILLALALALPLAAYGERLPNYETLRERYLKLRNTDARVVRSSEWELLGKELVEFVDRNRSDKQAPFAIIDATILYEKLYNRFGDTERLQKVVNLLDRIARDYPGHELADDSLLRRGDLLLFELRDTEKAERAYQEIVRAYPGSDMYPVARARLNELQSGAWKEKHTDTSPAESVAESAGKKVFVVIDPGHGGEDYGAIGVGGLLEKDVTLAVALQLEELLTQKLGAVVRLTRRRDVFVPLMDRTALANDFEADLFISLHTNASDRKTVRGFEVYYLDNSDDKASRILAERENSSVRFEGPEGDLQYMLSDLIQNAKLEDSILLANILNKSVQQRIGKGFGEVKFLGVKRAPFYVLVGAHMPCVLVEMFFIDQAQDGNRLADPAFRSVLADGIFNGVSDFLGRAR